MRKIIKACDSIEISSFFFYWLSFDTNIKIILSCPSFRERYYFPARANVVRRATRRHNANRLPQIISEHLPR